MLALRDQIPLRETLERLGLDTAPLDLPPPPEAVAFARVAPGHAFAWQDHVWTRATLDQALAATPDRAAHPRVVAAYLAAAQRGRAATAFRWASEEKGPAATCIADRVDAAESVIPVASATAPGAEPPPPAWISMADQAPDLGRSVTVATASGPITARLLLDDVAAGGAVWQTPRGDPLDLDEVSQWRA